MARHHVVIAGAGVGGLSAAIYARLQGHSVLVLEKGGNAGGKARSIVQEGFRLDPGPSIIILPRIYERVFRDAGRNMGDYLRFERLDPISRVLYPSLPAPLDLPANREECSRVVDDLSASDGGSFRKLMSKLDRVSPIIDRTIFDHPYDRAVQLMDPKLISIGLRFDIRKSYRQLVDGWFESPLLRAFFYGFPSYGGQSYESKAPGALMIPYLMVEEGVFYPIGGVAAIPQALLRLAIELGVEFRFGAEVHGLRSQDGKIVSACLSEEEVEADAFISNIDRLQTRAWLGHSVDWPASLSYFTVQWGLRRKLTDLRHHTLLIPADFQKGFDDLYTRKAFPDPPIVYLNETASTDPAVAPDGCTNLFAVVTTPSEHKGLDCDKNVPQFRGIVLRAMEAQGVSIADKDIVFERIQTPAYFHREHGNYRGSLYGPAESHRLFGMLPLSNRDPDYANLFYCGGSVQPGAGLPMVTLSGMFAARQMESAMKR